MTLFGIERVIRRSSKRLEKTKSCLEIAILFNSPKINSIHDLTICVLNYFVTRESSFHERSATNTPEKAIMWSYQGGGGGGRSVRLDLPGSLEYMKVSELPFLWHSDQSHTERTLSVL